MRTSGHDHDHMKHGHVHCLHYKIGTRAPKLQHQNNRGTPTSLPITIRVSHLLCDEKARDRCQRRSRPSREAALGWYEHPLLWVRHRGTDQSPDRPTVLWLTECSPSTRRSSAIRSMQDARFDENVEPFKLPRTVLGCSRGRVVNAAAQSSIRSNLHVH